MYIYIYSNEKLVYLSHLRHNNFPSYVSWKSLLLINSPKFDKCLKRIIYLDQIKHNPNSGYSWSFPLGYSDHNMTCITVLTKCRK
jgi:hypothetical protein